MKRSAEVAASAEAWDNALRRWRKTLNSPWLTESAFTLFLYDKDAASTKCAAGLPAWIEQSFQAPCSTIRFVRPALIR